MKFIADLHIHSKYSRATSKNMDLEHLDKWAKLKGIRVLGTADFTHPEWFKNLKEKLEPAGAPGIFRLKPKYLKKEGKPSTINSQPSETFFILTSEISCIYSKNGRVRKIHLIIFAPSFKVVEEINARLGWEGNLKSDGRPILGMDAKELTKIVLGVSDNCLIVPAHVWTPWFSLFGSRSGFDSIEECFEEYSKYIQAGETGLSSNPPMNWRLSALDRITLISNSDAHSPRKIGREANVFDTEISYPAIMEAIKSKDPEKFLYTIEFFPEEGKYHYDGHRNCEVSLSPQESKKYNNICPVCGKPLTIGVLNRVEELANREEGFEPKGAIPFKSLVPLEEIIAESLGVNTGTKQVMTEYKNLIEKFASEFNILLDTKREELESAAPSEIVEGIIRVRKGKVHITPGFDGVFGKINIFSKGEQKALSKQGTLF
jgi:uncharacterized protein (TIGR00375 family)